MANAILSVITAWRLVRTAEPGATAGGFGGFGELKVWDVATGKVVLNLPGHTNSVSSVAFSPDGTRLAELFVGWFDGRRHGEDLGRGHGQADFHSPGAEPRWAGDPGFLLGVFVAGDLNGRTQERFGNLRTGTPVPAVAYSLGARGWPEALLRELNNENRNSEKSPFVDSLDRSRRGSHYCHSRVASRHCRIC